MAAIPVIDNPTLEALCAVLGDTDTEKTGVESHFLATLHNCLLESYS